MADKTGIQWTDATWNPIAGCSLVSPGCTNCYAMKMAARIEAMSAGSDKQTHYAGTTMPTKAGPVWTGTINVAPEHILTQPLRWKRPRRIFVNSMSDLFHDAVDDATIDKVFAVMSLCPQHTFQVLTKRADRMLAYLSTRAGDYLLRWPEAVPAGEWPITKQQADLQFGNFGKAALGRHGPIVSFPLPNVWLGVSVEDTVRANERIPDLLKTPAAVRWISAEPLLGGMSLRSISWAASDRGFVDALTGETQHKETRVSHPDRYPATNRLNWVVAGGESGPGARPMHPDWARGLRDQCAAAGVPFFFKQWGSWAPVDHCDKADTRLWDGKPGVRKLRRDGSQTVPDGKWPDQAAGECYISPMSKKAAGDLLDGVQHHSWPVPGTSTTAVAEVRR